MSYKEQNTALAKKILSSAFWRLEYFPRYYADSFTMDFPCAPPGMPNHFNVWESERCFEWLNRTVMSWSVDLEKFYSTPNPDQFWGIGICRGDTFWNQQKGFFQSKFFVQLEMKDGKVNYMKGWMDSLAFLRAAGMEYPYIIKKLDDPKVDEFMANPPARLKQGNSELKDLTGPDAAAKRLEANLQQNVCGVEREKYRQLETFNPTYKRGAWFIPDKIPWSQVEDMDTSICDNAKKMANPPADLKPRISAWVKASSPWMYRDTRGSIYPTDDPLVYFAEMHSSGPSMWIGNDCEQGHYHQEYLMYCTFDENGCEVIRDEVISASNKYCATGISLPSFPYYM